MSFFVVLLWVVCVGPVFGPLKVYKGEGFDERKAYVVVSLVGTCCWK